MSTRYRASCDCGWHGTYPTSGRAAVALARHSCELQRRLREAARAALAREKAIDRTPKPCTHPLAAHKHGTYAAYTLDRCRCMPCALACSAYNARAAKARAYGRENLVPAQAVRTHVYALKAAGYGKVTIAERAGVSITALDKLLRGHGRDGVRRGPSRRVTRELAEKILAVPLPGSADVAPGALVDATGTRRRLQALAALGWSVQRIAGTHDLDRQGLDHALNSGTRVTARTARAVAEAFDSIGDQPPQAPTRTERAGVTRTRNRAQAAGWAPPAMWDPGDLDDPTAPEPTATVHRLEARVDLEEFVHLVRGGEDAERAARRLGVQLRTVDRAARRLERADVLALLRREAS